MPGTWERSAHDKSGCRGSKPRGQNNLPGCFNVPESPRYSQAGTAFRGRIVETARLTDTKRELSEEQKEVISEQLHVLKSRLKTDPTVTITYFVPDSRKAGGTYRSVTGAAKKVDEYLGILEMSNGITIPFDDILSLE